MHLQILHHFAELGTAGSLGRLHISKFLRYFDSLFGSILAQQFLLSRDGEPLLLPLL